MAAKRKTNTKKDDNTKKDLEEKIAQLEEKLTKLSQQLDSPSTSKSDEAPKPAETAKPKPTLPKGTASKPAETKPAETAKPKGNFQKDLVKLRTLQNLLKLNQQNQKVHFQKDLK